MIRIILKEQKEPVKIDLNLIVDTIKEYDPSINIISIYHYGSSFTGEYGKTFKDTYGDIDIGVVVDRPLDEDAWYDSEQYEFLATENYDVSLTHKDSEIWQPRRLISSKKLQESLMLEYEGSEKTIVDDEAAKSISSILSLNWRPKEKAESIAGKIYRHRRKSSVSTTNTPKNIDYQIEDGQELVKQINNYINRSFSPNVVAKLTRFSNSWAFFEIGDKRFIDSIGDSPEDNNYNFYFSISYKAEYYTTNNLKNIKDDWNNILKNLCVLFANEYEDQHLKKMKFKFTRNIGSFMTDNDNLKFYFKIPKQTIIGNSFSTSTIPSMKKIINASKYFITRNRTGAEITREAPHISYGMIISSYLATKIVDKYPTAIRISEEQVKQLISQILKTTNPTTLYNNFVDKYEIYKSPIWK